MTPPAPAVRTAPYALVRATVLSHPAQSPDAAVFRAGLERLTELEAALADLRPRLADALYESRGGHADTFHRDVVLPLRRAVHNAREPRPALLDRLGDLPERVPPLREWLLLRERLDSVRAWVAESAPGALTADREALAVQCREPAFALAASYTSADLLAAVERAAGGAGVGPDGRGRRARKEEPGVLRHAVRAATRTSPLSWFTAVGWGPLTVRPGARETVVAEWGEGDLLGTTHNSVRANRTLVTALSDALTSDPRRRALLPHRLTSAARTVDGRAVFARTRLVSAIGRVVLADEDEVEVAASAPLERVAELCRTPVTPARLAAALARPEDLAAASAYVQRLVDTGLLVPVPPVGPQDPEPLAALAGWLRSLGAEEDRALAGLIDEVADATGKFGAADPGGRTTLLPLLRELWKALLGAAGRPLPEGEPAPIVLSEDVAAREPVDTEGLLTDADHEALHEVGALAELFDLGHVLRRAVRDRFVARHGVGGVCHPIWDFAKETIAAREDTIRTTERAPGEEVDLAALPTKAPELALLRQEFVRDVHERAGAREDPDADVVLPSWLVTDVARRLPGWTANRPLSYAHFLQRDGRRGLLALNHLYGGWGRIGSRFLDQLDPRAAGAVGEEVAREVGSGRGRGSRPVQFRLVRGFNANLQPLFLPDEITSDEVGPGDTEPAGRGPISESDVELFHDVASDEVRLRLREGGEPLDVFYPGLLVPDRLTTRSAPLIHDHPEGVVSFASLVPQHVSQVPGGALVRTPRLRHRHVVLRRRRWKLAPGTVAELRAALTADGEVPFEAAARWRSLLGVPDQLFLHPVLAPPAEEVGPDGRAPDPTTVPKPQFVDLGSALHLRCLDRWLARHPEGVVLEEALPAPGGRARPARAVELVVETYRAGSGS
ncbi:lantibiotic dehydratase [Streptomyces sp. NPDC048606]|uniref:lantibiotic dehydratase n=1 Tax=Streptomyces sp. NPDC048606 TaxID=3154726 RepID=UPI00343A35FA